MRVKLTKISSLVFLLSFPESVQMLLYPDSGRGSVKFNNASFIDRDFYITKKILHGNSRHSHKNLRQSHRTQHRSIQTGNLSWVGFHCPLRSVDEKSHSLELNHARTRKPLFSGEPRASRLISGRVLDPTLVLWPREDVISQTPKCGIWGIQVVRIEISESHGRGTSRKNKGAARRAPCSTGYSDAGLVLKLVNSVHDHLLGPCAKVSPEAALESRMLTRDQGVPVRS